MTSIFRQAQLSVLAWNRSLYGFAICSIENCWFPFDFPACLTPSQTPGESYAVSRASYGTSVHLEGSFALLSQQHKCCAGIQNGIHKHLNMWDLLLHRSSHVRRAGGSSV